MSDTTSFVLVYPDAAYPSSRVLSVGTGLALDISGSAVTINPGERLSSLATMNANGIVCYTASSKTYTPRSFVNGTGIIINQQDGQGNITISQDPETVIQKVQVTNVDAEDFATSSTVQFVSGSDDIDIATSTDPDTGYAVVEISSTNPRGTVTSVALSSSNAFITVSGSPITSSGTIALTINTLSIAKGGTGQTTASAAFNALSPITSAGDLIIGTGVNTASRLPVGSSLQVLQINSSTGLPYWSSAAGTGSVTSIALTSSSGVLLSGSPITSSGTITVNLPGTGASNAVVAGDLLVGGSGTYGALAVGAANRILGIASGVPAWVGGAPSSGDVLTYNGSAIDWAAPATSGTVTSVAVTSSNAFISVSGSPITSSGTIALTVNTLGIDKGGTGQTTASAAFSALSPITTTGDMIYSSGGTINSRLGIGSTNQVLAVLGGVPTWVAPSATSGNVLTYNGSEIVWAAPATSGTVTSVGVSSSTGLIVGSTPVTSSGTITVNLPGTGASNAVVQGDMIIGNTGGSYTTVAIGTTGKLWTSNGTTASWQSPATSGTVTSVGISSSNAFITVTGTPVTSSGTIALTINTLSIAKGGTGATAASNAFTNLSPIIAPYDMIAGNGTGVPDRLPIGTNGQVLTVSGGAPTWAAPATSGTVTSVGVSSSTGLTVGSTPVTSSGTITVNLPGSGASSAVVRGDLLVGGNATGAYAALALGTLGKALVVAGSTATWGTVAINGGGTGATTANAAFQALSPMTTDGDTIYYNSSPSRLAIGSSNTFLRSNGSLPAWSTLYSTSNSTTGTVTNFSTTQTVSTTAVSATSVITLTITDMVGSPTVAPAVYVGTIVGGVSFQIIPVAVGGGGGKASTISVRWAVA